MPAFNLLEVLAARVCGSDCRNPEKWHPDWLADWKRWCASCMARYILASTATRTEELRSLQPNWDSYGAMTISEPAIAAALEILHSTGHLTPCSDGGVQIDWPGAEISFGPDGEQDFDILMSGDAAFLPTGVTLKATRHHSEPEFEIKSREK